jgi:hypothetical protein
MHSGYATSVVAFYVVLACWTRQACGDHIPHHNASAVNQVLTFQEHIFRVESMFWQVQGVPNLSSLLSFGQPDVPIAFGSRCELKVTALRAGTNGSPVVAEIYKLLHCQPIESRFGSTPEPIPGWREHVTRSEWSADGTFPWGDHDDTDSTAASSAECFDSGDIFLGDPALLEALRSCDSLSLPDESARSGITSAEGMHVAESWLRDGDAGVLAVVASAAALISRRHDVALSEGSRRTFSDEFNCTLGAQTELRNELQRAVDTVLEVGDFVPTMRVVDELGMFEAVHDASY